MKSASSVGLGRGTPSQMAAGLSCGSQVRLASRCGLWEQHSRSGGARPRGVEVEIIFQSKPSPNYKHVFFPGEKTSPTYICQGTVCG